MTFNDFKYAATDWVKERRYAQGILPVAVIAIVLGGCLIWIGSFFVGGDSYSMPKVVLSPRDVESARINEQLRAEERFMHVTAVPSPEDENGIVLTGEVHKRADRTALDAFIKQLTSTYTVTIGEILVMESQ